MHGPNTPDLDGLLEPLGRCLTIETARRIVKLRANARLRSRIAKLAEKCNEGLLSAEERAEFESYVWLGNFIAILQSKARALLAKNGKTR